MDFTHINKVGICTPLPPAKYPLEDMRNYRTREFLDARLSLRPPFAYNMTEIRIVDMEVGEARNEAARRALELGMKYLFFLDWDVIAPPDAVHRLVTLLDNRPDVDIAAGFYCAKIHPAPPLIYKAWSDGVFWDWTPGELIEDLVGVGMGCTCIRMDLFLRLPTDELPWFKTHYIKPNGENGGGRMTEDLWFCRRAVEEAGAKIVVDTAVACPHISHDTHQQFGLDPESLPMRRKRTQNAKLLKEIVS